MTDSNRASRFLGRHVMRRYTRLVRCFDCGRASKMPGGNVGVRQTAEGVGFAGLETCGRVWLCPVCNAKVMARRAVEVGVVLTWAAQQDVWILFGALTCRHNVSSDLAELFRIQADAWRRMTQARFWAASSATDTVPHGHSESCGWDCQRVRDTVLSARRGRVGYIRAAEVTVGGNGWHPHYHPIIVYRGTRAQAEAFAARVVVGWIEAVGRSGGEAEGGDAQRLRVLDTAEAYEELSSYITKATFEPAKLALEMVWSQGKSGRNRAKQTASHWSLLARLEADPGDLDAERRWVELELAAHEHRMLTWSRGLRRFAGLMDEKDDDQIAAEELGTVEDTVAVITAEGWLKVRDEPQLMSLILDQLAGHGMDGFARLLDACGIEWTTVDGLASVVPEDTGEAVRPDVHRTGWEQGGKLPKVPGASGLRPEGAEPVWMDADAVSHFARRAEERAKALRTASRQDDDFWLYFDYSQTPPPVTVTAPPVKAT